MRFFVTLLLPCFLLLTGCSRQALRVHNEWLTLEDLASHHVDAPDHRRENPPIGQRIDIRWFINRKAWARYDYKELVVKARYGNREVDEVRYPIRRQRGRYEFKLVKEEYFNRRGISAYLIQLRGDDHVIDEWRHQLWAEVVSVGGS